MSGDVQNGNLKNQLEKELPRDASQRIEGRTSDLYTTQTSNDGKDYISNLPQLIIRGIVKYLDGESLWKCSRVIPVLRAFRLLLYYQFDHMLSASQTEIS